MSELINNLVEIEKDEFGEYVCYSGDFGQGTNNAILVDARELECPEHVMIFKNLLKSFLESNHEYVGFITSAATIVSPVNKTQLTAQLDLEVISETIENGEFSDASEDNPITVLYTSKYLKQAA